MNTVDLTKALESFAAVGAPAAPSDDPIEALRHALDAVLDRAQATQLPLEQEDTVARSRQAYCAGILRILDYLLLPMHDAKGLEAQAKIALGYVRHIETSRLAALQIGRTAKDDTLATAVQELRQQVTTMAEKRALVMNEVEDRRRLKLAKVNL